MTDNRKNAAGDDSRMENVMRWGYHPLAGEGGTR
jgi:hypothetical protein